MTKPAESLEAYILVAQRIFDASSDLSVLLEDRNTLEGFDLQTARYALVRGQQIMEASVQWLSSFDEVDISYYEGPSDPVRRMDLWLFERDLRTSMVRNMGALDVLVGSARALVNSADATTVVQGYEGESMQSVAARARGDWKAWRELHQANPDIPIGQTAGGQVIVVPPEA